jgi:hypothetical protein
VASLQSSASCACMSTGGGGTGTGTGGGRRRAPLARSNAVNGDVRAILNAIAAKKKQKNRVVGNNVQKLTKTSSSRNALVAHAMAHGTSKRVAESAVGVFL